MGLVVLSVCPFTQPFAVLDLADFGGCRTTDDEMATLASQVSPAAQSDAAMPSVRSSRLKTSRQCAQSAVVLCAASVLTPFPPSPSGTSVICDPPLNTVVRL